MVLVIVEGLEMGRRQVGGAAETALKRKSELSGRLSLRGWSKL
jgi:hypothetical protein